jgi:hypothetical protein
MEGIKLNQQCQEEYQFIEKDLPELVHLEARRRQKDEGRKNNFDTTADDGDGRVLVRMWMRACVCFVLCCI